MRGESRRNKPNSYYVRHRDEITQKYNEESQTVRYRCKDCSARITTGITARKHVMLLAHIVEIYKDSSP